jgi:alpha-amylase/alpha-mannosidase (GH57 family)
VFFYDGPISQAVAFEALLERGENFAGRLGSAFSDQDRSWPQIVHIATDGETYGHHHVHGDMALAYALHHIEKTNLARLTIYGEYLAKHPPTFEAQIWESSSCSCAHGVERWTSNCGCNSGGHPDWNQEWRAPLRNAFDWLRDTITPKFEQKGRELFRDPWSARNEYIHVILDRHIENRNRFFDQQALRPLNDDEKITAFKLLEMQRHAMLMYTSCGWFFDELSGIETTQVIQYAPRALCSYTKRYLASLWNRCSSKSWYWQKATFPITRMGKLFTKSSSNRRWLIVSRLLLTML